MFLKEISGMPLSKKRNRERMRVVRIVQPVQPTKANSNLVQPKREKLNELKEIIGVQPNIIVINGVPYRRP
jgi:mitochondrial fission protein ELM1